MAVTREAVIRLGTLALLPIALASCKTTDDQRESSGAATDQPPPRTTVAGIMVDKMSHTYAIMEGISLANLRQVEVNAVELYELSQQSDWMVHRTVSYTAFSDRFRGVVLQLANHARDDDLTAVRDDYLEMINSCFECHDYLRRENLISDFPGRVGWQSGSILDRLVALQR